MGNLEPSGVSTRAILALAFSGFACLVSSPGFGQDVPGCGSLQNAYGPFDYRDPAARGGPLHLVEAYHFNSGVESLVRGKSGAVISDIDYTLRAFPNHHRALTSVSRYAIRGGKFANEEIPSADCFFERAIVFAPDDEIVRAIYANHLAATKETESAREQYEEALKLAPMSPEINYNAGLFFLSLGDLARAQELATIAYDKGHPLPGLRQKLDLAVSKSKSQK